MAEEDHQDDAGGRFSGYVPSGATGTTAVREQLTAVKKELDIIVHELRGPGGQVQAVDLEEVERLVRHLEVDRGELAQRCRRLAEENKDLLEVNKKMEVELYASQRKVDEAERKLRHEQIDRPDPEGPGKPDVSAEERLTQEALEALSSSSSRGAASPSRGELARALRAAQEELAAQRRRNEKLERQRMKDSQRVHLLEDAVERQRLEIAAIRLQKQSKLGQAMGKPKALHHLASSSRPAMRKVMVTCPSPSLMCRCVCRT
ncbi:unnamed protein product [Effrenium voratum]|nr:unnamed protein product [Effrenium voratum]